MPSTFVGHRTHRLVVSTSIVTPIFSCHRSLIITFSRNAHRRPEASRRRDHALRDGGFRIKILEDIFSYRYYNGRKN